MPLELGIFLGAQRYGGAKQKNKQCLVLDKDKYCYQEFISDIAGQDIQGHGSSTDRIIRAVREFQAFQRAKRGICKNMNTELKALTYHDLA